MDSSMVESTYSDSDAFSLEPKAIKKQVAKKVVVAKVKPATNKLTQTTLTTKAATKKRLAASRDNENDTEPDKQNFNDESLLSNTPPSAKRQKQAPTTKKSNGKPFKPIENESFGLDGAVDEKPKLKKGGASSEQYQKLTQLEHILKRPDTYIGSIERTEKQMWVFNSETEMMESREVSYVPGLYKIFDEILVNAADNKVRDKSMDEIKVTIDREIGDISVRNNGRGIPIELHEKEGIYIPEMIFGHLLTSSNYDDDQDKVTGGRNGYGAKLCNVYSTTFTLETADRNSGHKYKQTWTNNMSMMEQAKITSHKGDDFTKVTFHPDYKRFGMTGMDADFEALIKRRVYDMAGTCKDVKVFLNGEKIKVKGFKKYMEMYTKAIQKENMLDGTTTQVILTDNPHERWEIGFAVSDGSFQQVSFVNSIATTSGGTHVNYIADQITNKLLEIVKKKNKGGVILKNNQIRNHIFLFINCQIVNPAFTSQTKEQMTTKASQFGSKCTVSEKFLKDIAKTEAVNNIIHFAQQKADQVLKKTDGHKRTRMNNPKLTDANKAGTKDGHRCTLILTEGDSASLLALAGRAVVDPDLIGVFPLRGKLLNVRDASVDQISKNQEIQNIKQFMGLQHKKEYVDTRGLRYGHLMIMTDQDHDGSHIKGLLINFFECSFPSLLKIKDFLQVFITPIVKVWKGEPSRPRKLQSFFTMPEYEAWRQLPGNSRGWEHKYFKGLGTSSPSDAEIYFRDLDKHLKQFQVLRPGEPELIEKAFSKKKADERKEWLREFKPGTFLDMSAGDISYDDFINKELILFSMADNLRSIPSVIDGFKPGQRKVLYTCFRRNLRKDVKVVELAGSVAGLTAYAYGDTSLQQTIVGLAQNFVGSNNINCLEPSGNFGSRLQGGSDCASARYIYTRLSPFARRIFIQADEPLLLYNTDDGKTIEPETYIPILPMILVNGADGIGTGWSSSIPNYNPEEIVENLKARMQGTSKDDMKTMKPWFRGWTGDVEDLGDDRYRSTGFIQQTGDNEVEITELPVRMWTQEFKDKLEDIIKAEKVESYIKDYVEYNTPVKVHFIIKLEDKYMKAALEKGLEEQFKLSKSMATSNMVAFDSHGRIHKYASVLDIMEEFYHVRLRFYEQRKQFMLNEMQAEWEKLSNQARFIKMIIDGQLVVSRKRKHVLVTELKAKDFLRIPRIVDARKEGEFEAVVENEGRTEEEAEEDRAIGATDYDYLLGMAIWSLTEERVEKLMKQIGDKELEMEKLTKTSPKQLWTTDLDDFISEWRFQLADEAQRTKKIAALGRRASSKLRIAGKAGSKKRKADDDGDNSEDDYVEAILKRPTTSKSVTTKPLPEPTLVSSIEQKPVAKPPASQMGLLKGLLLGKDTSKSGSDNEVDARKKLSKTAAKPNNGILGANSKKHSKMTSFSKALQNARHDNDDASNGEDDYDFTLDGLKVPKSSLVRENPHEFPAAHARSNRAAARKPTKYVDSDNSMIDDLDGDLLGDVSDMVKGIGTTAANAASGGSKLFNSKNSRQTVSVKASARRFSKFMNSDDDDETNYAKLVPHGSPEKPAARNAREVIISDDDNDSLNIGRTKALTKSFSIKSAATKPKPVSQVAKPLKEALGQPAKKPSPLSPAAKAYAAKQARSNVSATKTARKKAKKSTAGDDDVKEDDVDALADRILLSDDSDIVEKPESKVAVPAAHRPVRRAAAATSKPKYIVDEDDDDDDYDDKDVSLASEGAYDDNDEEED